MVRSIIVPLDGSTFGEQALPLALTLAKRANVPLTIVHVHVPLAPIYREPIPGIEGSIEPAVRKREQAYLDKVVARIQPQTSVRLETRMLEGGVAESLVEYAVAQPDALLVLTTHGRGPLRRFWLGSVADQLLRRTPVPAVILHPQEGAKPVDGKQELELRKILIALDGSAEAEQILEPALAFGKLMNAEFTLLRVVEPILLVGNDLIGYPMPLAEDPELEERKIAARTYLEAIAEKVRATGAKADVRVVVGFQPAISIVDDASAHDLSMVAMQTHGRRGLARLLLGSVADKVIRSAHTPVLIYRPPTK